MKSTTLPSSTAHRRKLIESFLCKYNVVNLVAVQAKPRPASAANSPW